MTAAAAVSVAPAFISDLKAQSPNEQLNVDLPGAGAVFYKGDPQKDVRITGAGSVVDAN